jgi:hypothetical protein
MSSERRPDRAPALAGARGMRRAADRHYLAVVAAEARRLGRQLRPSPPSGIPPNPTTIGKHAPPQGAH